jgi:hypothetical protein
MSFEGRRRGERPEGGGLLLVSLTPTMVRGW